jgi:hypothetical protein
MITDVYFILEQSNIKIKKEMYVRNLKKNIKTKKLFNKFTNTILTFIKIDEMYKTSVAQKFLDRFIETLSTNGKYLSEESRYAINEIKKINIKEMNEKTFFQKMLPNFYKNILLYEEEIELYCQYD